MAKLIETMSSSKFLSALSLLISFYLLLQLAASYPTSDQCRGTNLPPNDPYNVSVTNLLGFLVNNTPSTGFASDSVGQNVDQVYGLAMCRGDLNVTECKSCVEGLSNLIQTNCQATQATASDDECEVRYSNTNFLGQVDQADWYYAALGFNASNPVSYNQSVMALMTNLSQTAYASPKLYAAGSLEVTGSSMTIYGLVQCTKDLAAVDCEGCVTRALDWFPQYLYGKDGGKLFGGSCNVRFEKFKFFN